MELDLDPIPSKINKFTSEFKDEKSTISPIMKIESPIKSQITNEINEISFENDLYQPEWFSEGE